MLHRAELLHGAVAAVVVGEEQAVLRDDFTGAEEAGGFRGAAQTHDGILQAAIVDTVEFFGSQLKTHLLHIHIVQTLHEHREPHAFVGTHSANHSQDGESKNKYFFHLVIIIE